MDTLKKIKKTRVYYKYIDNDIVDDLHVIAVGHEKCRHDKKAGNDKITVVYVEKIGSYELRDLSFDEFNEYIGKVKI